MKKKLWKKKMFLKDLPVVLIKYISTFLESDLESFSKFALINKKNENSLSCDPSDLWIDQR